MGAAESIQRNSFPQKGQQWDGNTRGGVTRVKTHVCVPHAALEILRFYNYTGFILARKRFVPTLDWYLTRYPGQLKCEGHSTISVLKEAQCLEKTDA